MPLAIPDSFLKRYRLPPQIECQDLVSFGRDLFDREQRMERQAAVHWKAMHDAARADGVILLVISAYRSFAYQRGIVERKLAMGLTLEQITRTSALPGYSEHHTGRAIDIGVPGTKPLTEEFEMTPAFHWLTRRAGDFGFTMTYPRGNSFGVVFEPWHWAFQPKEKRRPLPEPPS
jgi:D-alanyl-D-alanine carboxypeptidase